MSLSLSVCLSLGKFDFSFCMANKTSCQANASVSTTLVGSETGHLGLMTLSVMSIIIRLFSYVLEIVVRTGTESKLR